MSSGLLSLKWNNHRSTFFHVLSSIRSKESYCDATLACDGRFYPVHKLVLSTCSEYFEQIFERTQCKHPVIVLKDIKFDDLEALMNYMYVGEVNVLQEKLAGLIKAAECLKIKGLAVPDEDPLSSSKRISNRLEADSPHAKRRRREDSFNYEDHDRSSSSRSSRLSQRDQQIPQLETHIENSQLEQASVDTNIADNHSQRIESESEQQNDGQKNHRAKHNSNESANRRISSQKPVPEVSIDETSVKSEPPDIQEEVVEDSKEALHSNLGYDPGEDADSVNADPASVASGSNEAPYSDSNLMDSTPQSVEDVVAQAIPPTSSSFQGNSFSLWEGEGSLQNFPGEGFSGENSQGRPMVKQQLVAERTPSWASSSSFAGLCLQEPNMLEGQSVSDSCPYSLAISDVDLQLSGRNCPLCHRNFPSPSHMKRHFRTHTGEKPFKCSLCSYETADKGNLDKHHKQHTGERPFPCTMCPYRATQKIHLLSHLRVHTKEKQYGCDICFKRFGDNQTLQLHITSIHCRSSNANT